MTEPNDSPPRHGQLVPTLGLFTTVMIVVGGVIGSGIFRKPGVMAGQLGSTELLLAVFVIVVLTVVNYLGVRFGGVVQNISTSAKGKGSVR